MLALIPADARDWLAKATDTATELSAVIGVLDDARGAALLRVIATIRAEGEALRKRDKAPVLAAGREIDAAYKGPDAELARVETLIRNHLAAAALRREEERRAALALAATAAQAGDHAEANAAMVRVDAAVAVPVEGIAERWSWEVSSVALHKVPTEYLVLDLPKVREEIKQAVREGREPSIPGVTFVQSVGLTVRRVP